MPKKCALTCVTQVPCVSVFRQLSPDSSLVEHAILHCKGTVPDFGFLRASPAWYSLDY